MKEKFELTKEEFEKIIAINKEDGDRVMYLSGGTPLGSGKGGAFRSKQQKINDYWDELAEKYGFDWNTIEPIDNTHFYAEKK